MTNGKRWIVDSAIKVGLACRAGKEGKPVACASDLVRGFVGKQLESAAMIAAAEDYLANAVIDLLLFATWNVVTDSVPGEAIPPWLFARDDRVFRHWVDCIAAAKKEKGWAKVPRVIKATCQTVITVYVVVAASALLLFIALSLQGGHSKSGKSSEGRTAATASRRWRQQHSIICRARSFDVLLNVTYSACIDRARSLCLVPIGLAASASSTEMTITPTSPQLRPCPRRRSRSIRHTTSSRYGRGGYRHRPASR